MNKIKQIEDKLQSNDYHSIFQDDVEETVLLQPKYYRSIFHGLSERQRDLGRIQMLIERNNLIMKFATETEQTWQGPQISIHLRERIKLIQSSVEFMSIEMKNLSGRLQSQVMIITNLISQQDIVLSTQISKDSTAIAVATRRDSVAMKIIAGVGTVFLPATLISVRLISRSLSNTYKFRLFSHYFSYNGMQGKWQWCTLQLQSLLLFLC